MPRAAGVPPLVGAQGFAQSNHRWHASRDQIRYAGKPGRRRTEKSASLSHGTERRQGRGSTLTFHSSGLYRDPHGGHYPSRSRTHFPAAATGRLAADDRPSLGAFCRVLFPFSAVFHSFTSILPAGSRRVNPGGVLSARRRCPPPPPPAPAAGPARRSGGRYRSGSRSGTAGCPASRRGRRR